MKKEKSQPDDTTGAGPGRDSYQSKSKGQHHQKPKARQDGVNQKGYCEASAEAQWTHQDSEQEGENFSA